MFIILSESNLFIYEYSLKSREPPTQVNSIPVKEEVRFVRFLKDTLLGIFYFNSYEIYNIENIYSVKKKLEKNYPVDKAKRLLAIPPSVDNIINVFFEEEKEKRQSFSLWCLEINFES
jgi:hypothetical protein